MMLRRLKEDVEKSIAPKEETIIEVGASTHHTHSDIHSLTHTHTHTHTFTHTHTLTHTLTGGIDSHPEAVLSCHSGEKLHIPLQGANLHSPLPAQCHDGTEKVLQPSLPHCRYQQFHHHLYTLAALMGPYRLSQAPLSHTLKHRTVHAAINNEIVIYTTDVP